MKLNIFKSLDLKLIVYLVIYYTVVVFLSTAKVINQRLSAIEEGKLKADEIDWNTLYYNLCMDWMIVISLMIILSYFTKKMIEKKISWKYILTIHLFFALILGWIIYFMFNIISIIKGDYAANQLFSEMSFKYIISVADLNFLIYTAMTAIIYIYYYVKEVKKIEQQKADLTVQLNNTKLNLLKSNLHPHFLFNTLNSISSLIQTNAKQAQNTIADLGDLLRDLLEQKDKSLITVEEELLILKKYLNIIKIRFTDHFTFEKEIETNVLDAQIPSMLLQPLIENAIKHGYSYDYTDLAIKLEIKQKDDQLNILVINNGKPLDKPFFLIKKGLGIKNTIERLKTIYKNNFDFYIENLSNQNQVVANVSIPYSTK